jgi:hypothetical protein
MLGRFIVYARKTQCLWICADTEIDPTLISSSVTKHFCRCCKLAGAASSVAGKCFETSQIVVVHSV